MELIKVDYLEESTTAIFFTVTYISHGFFSGRERIVRNAFLEKWSNRYSNNFKWSDNIGDSNFDTAIVQAMILIYEKNKL